MSPRIATDRRVAAVPAVLLVLGLVACSRPPELLELRGSTMGTTYSVKVVLPKPGESRGDQHLAGLVAGRLEQIDAAMSTYRPESEVSRFNREPAGRPFHVSPDLLEVLRVAQQVSADTGGSFDVTVGPLVDLWGFGPAPRPPSPPPNEELLQVAARIGYQHLSLDVEHATISKAVDGLEIDLSAIAKGYAVDRVSDDLDVAGFHRYLVEVGGELRASGLGPTGHPWRVAIEQPVPDTRAIERVLPMTSGAMATSGDYRNFYELDGHRYSHEIDPHTLRPVTHQLASASVLHPRACEADALATALMVMGPEHASAYAEQRNLAVLLIVHEGDGALRELQSTAMQALLAQNRSATNAPAQGPTQ